MATNISYHLFISLLLFNIQIGTGKSVLMKHIIRGLKKKGLFAAVTASTGINIFSLSTLLIMNIYIQVGYSVLLFLIIINNAFLLIHFTCL